MIFKLFSNGLFNLQHWRQVAFEKEQKRKQMEQLKKNKHNKDNKDDEEEDKSSHDSKMEKMKGKAHRFWIENETIPYKADSNNDKITYQLGNAQMKIKKHFLELNEKGELVDAKIDSNDESGEGLFAQSFSQNYDTFANYFPIFNRLKMLLKISGVFRILHGQYDNVKEIKNKIDYNAIKSKISTALSEIRSDIVKKLDYWPINCSDNVSHMLDETLKLNNVSRWQVEQSEISRVEGNIRSNLNKQQREIEDTLCDTLCKIDGLSTCSSTHYEIKNNIYQWIYDGKHYSYSDSAHNTIAVYIANAVYNKQIVPINKLLNQLKNLGLDKNVTDENFTFARQDKTDKSMSNDIFEVDFIPTIFTDLSKINEN